MEIIDAGGIRRLHVTGANSRLRGAYRLGGIATAILLSLAACSTPPPRHTTNEHPAPIPPEASAPTGSSEVGIASWYGNARAGHRTASGEIFDPWGMTAAHRTLPFGTVVRVTNLDNGRTISVTINDRGPHDSNRIIDLSRGAAQALGFASVGLARVKVERVSDIQKVAAPSLP
ncbi:MAG TPA: septal ring lytic transglycosylase RlpA family protein [Stellaceae bacterium]|nr:septal ring lytic transglycosylase RlpA family protein [Stellaceae bacterium]